MRAILTRHWADPRADAMYGIIEMAGSHWVTCERMYHDNKPGESSIPEGFYALEPHHGERYPDTFAFVGATVSHGVDSAYARSNCVFHWEDDGEYLQGCISIGTEIVYTTNGSKLQGNKVDEFLDILKNWDSPVHLEIRK